MSFNKRTNGSKIYIGVYHTNDNKWISRLSHKGKVQSFGPFSTDKEAAKNYDEEVLKLFPQRTRLNFPSIDKISKNNSSRIQAIRKKFDKNLGKKRLSPGQQKKATYIREQFPQATRNLICARQKWSCNFCVDTLTDIFIIDHMVPLFLGGSNGTHNLQALCPSCDRFKTSYLDHKVLKPLYDKDDKLTAEQVGRIQTDHYHQKMCQAPNSTTTTTTTNDVDVETVDDESDSIQEKITKLSPKPEPEVKRRNIKEIVSNNSNEIEIKVGNTLIRVSSI